MFGNGRSDRSHFLITHFALCACGRHRLKTQHQSRHESGCEHEQGQEDKNCPHSNSHELYTFDE